MLSFHKSFKQRIKLYICMKAKVSKETEWLQKKLLEDNKKKYISFSISFGFLMPNTSY